MKTPVRHDFLVVWIITHQLSFAANSLIISVSCLAIGSVGVLFLICDVAGIRTLEEGVGVFVYLATLPDDGPSESLSLGAVHPYSRHWVSGGQLIGDHAPFAKANGEFTQIPW